MSEWQRNSAEAIEQARLLQPDIILMDVTMPAMNGLDTADRILQEDIPTKIIVLSMWGDEEYVRHAINIGVRGYVVKQTAASEVVSAIREVQKGNVFFSPSVSKVFIDFQKRSSVDRPLLLSFREKEVLQLITEGKSNQDICDMLLISIKTVEKYRQQIMDKLGVHDVASLTRYAFTKGLVK